MELVNKADVEEILKNHEKFKDMKKLVELEGKPAIPKGSNFASQVLRLKATLEMSDGTSKTVSLIAKVPPASEGMMELVEDISAFAIETKVYTDAIIKMNKLLDKVGDKEERVWCDMYGYKGENLIILEDLGELGYSSGNRHIGMSYEMSKIAMEKYGKFHATSYVLIKQGSLDPNSLCIYNLAMYQASLNMFMEEGLNYCGKIMKETWDPEWSSMGDQIIALGKTVPKDLNDAWKVTNPDYFVLCHGDSWINNLMFREGTATQKPSIRIIDLQECHYNSPAWDLTLLLSSSIRAEIKKTHYDDLLQTYWDSFVSSLDMYGFEKPPGATLEGLHKEIKRISMFGFMIVCTILPIAMADTSLEFDWSDLCDYTKPKAHTLCQYIQKDPRFVKALREELMFMKARQLI